MGTPHQQQHINGKTIFEGVMTIGIRLVAAIFTLITVLPTSLYSTQDIENAETRLRFLRMRLSHLPLPTL